MRALVVLLLPFFFAACTTSNANDGTSSLPQNGPYNVTFTNTLTDYPIQIYVEDTDGENLFLKTIGAGKRHTVNGVAEGQIFYFEPKGNSNYEILPFAADSSTNQEHDLSLAQKRYGEAKNAYKRITNALANRYSFDILKIDPFKIDADEARGGGRKQLLFEDLSDFDRDWYPFDGDFAVKNHFDVQFINEGKSNEQSELFSSEQTYHKSFSNSVSLGAGVGKKGTKGNATGTLSASWSKMTVNSKKQETFFSWFKKEDKKYFIELLPEKAKLHESFIQAVDDLPVPKTLPEDANKAITSGSYDAYKDFVEKWGTHYPKKVTYGGIIQGTHEVSKEQATQMVSKGFDLGVGMRGQIKGVDVEAGYGYSEEKGRQITNILETSSKEYVYKGGEGYFELWAVGDEVQPIYIELGTLAELINSDFIKNGNKLTAKSKMLNFAIDNYIENAPKPLTKESDLWAYELVCEGLKVSKTSDADRPINTLSAAKIQMYPRLGKHRLNKATRYIGGYKDVWSFDADDKQNIKLPKEEHKDLWGADNFTNKQYTFLISPNELTKSELDRIEIDLYVHLIEEDGWGSYKDETSSGRTKVPLKDIGTSWKKVEVSFSEEDEKLEGKVHFKMRKRNLFD